MDCDVCRKKLSPFLEGDLSAEESEKMRRHMENCRPCAAELAVLKQMVGSLKELPKPPVPPGFREGVWAKIDASPARRLKKFILEPWYFKLPVEVLATAAIALVVIQVFHTAGPRMTAPMEKKASDIGENRRQMTMDAAVERQMKVSVAGVKKAETPVAQSSSDRQEKRQRASDEFVAAQLHEPARQVPPSDKELAMEMEMAKAATPPIEEQKGQAAEKIFYLRLKVADLAEAQKRITLLLEKIPMRRIDWILPTRYDLVIRDTHLQRFLDELQTIGELDPSADIPSESQPPSKQLLHVVLDIIPS
ncbi:MAG: anti-sigma factor [Candidatus Omnitrophica bacterium]|nr:anti-sigma factor [Candidatus Omnitrophota bacterium]